MSRIKRIWPSTLFQETSRWTNIRGTLCIRHYCDQFKLRYRIRAGENRMCRLLCDIQETYNNIDNRHTHTRARVRFSPIYCCRTRRVGTEYRLCVCKIKENNLTFAIWTDLSTRTHNSAQVYRILLYQYVIEFQHLYNIRVQVAGLILLHNMHRFLNFIHMIRV